MSLTQKERERGTDRCIGRSTRLASHRLLKLARSEVAELVAEGAAGRDGRKVGLGQVNVWSEILPRGPDRTLQQGARQRDAKKNKAKRSESHEMVPNTRTALGTVRKGLGD